MVLSYHIYFYSNRRKDLIYIMNDKIITGLISAAVAGLVSCFVSKSQNDCSERVANNAMRYGYKCKIENDYKKQKSIINLSPSQYTPNMVEMVNGQPVLSKEALDWLTDIYIRYINCMQQMQQAQQYNQQPVQMIQPTM